MGGIDYRGVLKLCEQLTLRSDAILHIYGPTFAKVTSFTLLVWLTHVFIFIELSGQMNALF